MADPVMQAADAIAVALRRDDVDVMRARGAYLLGAVAAALHQGGMTWVEVHDLWCTTTVMPARVNASGKERAALVEEVQRARAETTVGELLAMLREYEAGMLEVAPIGADGNPLFLLVVVEASEVAEVRAKLAELEINTAPAVDVKLSSSTGGHRGDGP